MVFDEDKFVKSFFVILDILVCDKKNPIIMIINDKPEKNPCFGTHIEQLTSPRQPSWQEWVTDSKEGWGR